jgi:hypothetical protein
MKVISWLQAAVLAVLGIITSMSHSLSAQNFELDTEEIKALVYEWNYANNTGSLESFERVYDERVIYYTRNLKKAQCIYLKQKLVRETSGFKQTVVSPLTFTAHVSGVIKCDFTKEITTDSVKRQVPSYLIISYDKGQYKIVGESDPETDKRLNFKLDIGEQMDLPQAVTVVNYGSNADSLTARKLDKSLSSAIYKPATVLSHLETLITGDVVLTIPKVYLVASAALFLIALTVAVVFRKSSNRKTANGKPDRKQKTFSSSIERIEDNDLFINFILTLFDPLYFRVTCRDRSNSSSTIELDFRHKDTSARLAIQCIYLGTVPPDRIRFGSLDSYKHFETEKKTDFYLVVGGGGEASNPKEIFLIPIKMLNVEMSYADLSAFRKWGMFYFNGQTQRLV